MPHHNSSHNSGEPIASTSAWWRSMSRLILFKRTTVHKMQAEKSQLITCLACSAKKRILMMLSFK